MAARCDPMAGKSSVKLPLLFVALGGPLVGLGAYLRERAPNFEEWLKVNMADIPAAHGVGYAFATGWPLVAFMWIFGVALFIASLVTVHRVVSRIRLPLGTVVGGMFVLLYAWATVVTMQGAFSDFRWGFYVLSLGECLTAAALIVGIRQVIASVARRTKP